MKDFETLDDAKIFLKIIIGVRGDRTSAFLSQSMIHHWKSLIFEYVVLKTILSNFSDAEFFFGKFFFSDFLKKHKGPPCQTAKIFPKKSFCKKNSASLKLFKTVCRTTYSNMSDFQWWIIDCDKNALVRSPLTPMI